MGLDGLHASKRAKAAKETRFGHHMPVTRQTRGLLNRQSCMVEALVVRNSRPLSMFEYIHSQNIIRFQRQLSETNDEALRALLRRLIECEHDIQQQAKDSGQES